MLDPPAKPDSPPLTNLVAGEILDDWEGRIPDGMDVVVVPAGALVNHRRYARFAKWVAAALEAAHARTIRDVLFVADVGDSECAV